MEMGIRLLTSDKQRYVINYMLLNSIIYFKRVWHILFM